MTYLIQLLLVIKYESKMLLRSWPFRILTFLTVGAGAMQIVAIAAMIWWVSADSYLGPVFAGTNITMFALTGVSGMLGYVVVFFANDIGTRDRRIGIAEVVSSRPISTSQYVVGRMIGILLPLACLLAVVVAATLAVNKLLGFRVATVREYLPIFGYMCLVTLAFSIALAAFLSTVLRNRLLAAFTSLGILLLFAMWLGTLTPAFDISGFSTGGMISQLIGHGPIGELVVHRLMYVAITLMLIAGTVVLYPRMEGRRRSMPVLVCTVCAVTVAVGMCVYYYMILNGDERAREEWRVALTEATVNRSTAVDHYDMDISLLPKSHRLEATVKTRLRNRSDTPQTKFVFVLNPGLEVQDLSAAASELTFERTGPVIEVSLAEPLAVGGTLDIEWRYGGEIDRRTSQLKPVSLTSHQDRQRKQMRVFLGYMTGWIGPDFSFLLPESWWYPVPNSTYGYVYPEKPPKNWATARIAVDAPDGYEVVTQGTRLPDASATVHETSVPMPQFSLCVGKYEKISTDIGGVACEFYYAPIHSENVELFEDAAEEIQRAVGESIEKLEDGFNAKYPYSKLAVVEVPSQCLTFADSWDGRNLLVQPGVIFLKETDFFNVYFKPNINRAKKATKKAGTGATDAEVKTELLQRYFKSNVFGGDLEMNLLASFWEFQIDPTGDGAAALGLGFTSALSESLLGRGFTGSGHADKRVAKPAFVVDTPNGPRQQGQRLPNPRMKLDPNDLVVPLADLDPDEMKEDFFQLLKIKSKGLLRTLDLALEDEAWETFMQGFVERHRYSEVSVADLVREAGEAAGEDLSWINDQFASVPVIPGYMIREAEAFEIETDGLERQFMATVTVENLEEGKGYVELAFSTKGTTSGTFMRKTLVFDSREIKEIRTLLSEKPRTVYLDPGFARNVTTPRATLYVAQEPQDVTAEEYVRSVPAEEREFAVIVDDNDEGFSTIDAAEKKRGRLASIKEEQSGKQVYKDYMGYGRRPRNWQNEKTDRAYGKYLSTRKIKRVGEGSKRAVWQAELPKNGVYEVFAFIQPEGRKPRGRYRYTVKTHDGSQEVEVDLDNARDGWNSLGSFRFEAGGEARVELSDKVENERQSRSTRVLADAVKWVYSDASSNQK